MEQKNEKKLDDFVPTWVYIVSVLIPVAGIILGIINYAKGESILAKRIFVASIIGAVISAAAVWFFWFRAVDEVETAVDDALSIYEESGSDLDELEDLLKKYGY